MCGIVGLLLKKPALRTQLGELMVPMLIGMTERGPDSAGLAVFTEPLAAGQRKLSVYSGLTEQGAAYDWPALIDALKARLQVQASARTRGNHAVITFEAADAASIDAVKAFVKDHAPRLHLLSTGRSIELYKDIGTPAEVAARYRFGQLAGSHLVGHTRMATESAVTPDRAHPFTAGEDFCLVHNGSLSNPNGVRRMLEPRGIKFETDNDTEAGREANRRIEFTLLADEPVVREPPAPARTVAGVTVAGAPRAAGCLSPSRSEYASL